MANFDRYSSSVKNCGLSGSVMVHVIKPFGAGAPSTRLASSLHTLRTFLFLHSSLGRSNWAEVKSGRLKDDSDPIISFFHQPWHSRWLHSSSQLLSGRSHQSLCGLGGACPMNVCKTIQLIGIDSGSCSLQPLDHRQ